MGGIQSGRDALEFLAAGASSVALGTALFSDPAAPGRVRAELANEIATRGVDGADNAIGLAHAEPTAVSEATARAAAMSV
jgi:dihydroorotate dehydrogenase (NAD+) catalytic subunit